MKQGDLSKWTDISGCNNLLFFSQLVNELLFDYSIPSNRIATLNSHFLCMDANSAIDGIENHGVPEGTLKPIMEELYASLSKDVTFSLSSELPLSYFVKYDGNKYRMSSKPSELNYEELKRIAQALYTRYFSGNWYYESLKANIIKIVNNNRTEDQQDLFRLTKSVLTELINYGYSPMYIYYIMNQLFWNPSTPVSSANQIQDFFDFFTLKMQRYTVIFIVKKVKIAKLCRYAENIRLSDALEPKSNSHVEKQFLKIGNDEAFLAFEGRESVDPFQAAENGRDILEMIASYYRLCDHDFRYNISSIPCGVYSDDSFMKIGKGVRAVSHIKMPSSKQISESMHASHNAIEFMLSRKLYRDYVSLSNAVLFHSESLDSKSEKNQLLDFWAIFESVLDISNKHTADRIQQVCIYLVPILKMRYIYSLFLQLANDIKNYSETDYRTIIGTSTSEKDVVRKVCEFTLLDCNYDVREGFLLKCSGFPLLKERINYYNAMLSSPAQIYQFVEKHAEQVKWQVMRIYRNRNLIIHNGDSMPYLRLLIENLHSYVDDFLSYSIHALSNGHDLNSMRLELFSKECEWVANFSTKKECLTPEIIDFALAL